MSDDATGWGRSIWGGGPWGEPDEVKFEVTIVETNSPIAVGETLEVEVQVENVGASGEDELTLTIEEIE